MPKKFLYFFKIARQMPLQYMVFRLGYEFKKRTGILKRRFPIKAQIPKLFTLDEWRSEPSSFFKWDFTKIPTLPKSELKILFDRVSKIEKGVFPFFTDQEISIDLEDWHTNPLTGYIYDKDAHWTTLSDFDTNAGDIKYVWEKARFSWLYSFLRRDIYGQTDSSEFVFKAILSFIDQNSINKGPHYICSQEISIRILNWIFVLHFYLQSKYLTNEVFEKIINSIFLQAQHIYSNMQFSRIAVRNNHALTETLTLYIIGLLFPQFPSAEEWKLKGKKWFEKEIAYQVYEDGSYLQYSMNYHRIVVQLLTWAITLSEKNNARLSEIVYQKANSSIQFLEGCQDPVSGWLPHYGANDGALFFPLNGSNYRDFRPQLNALKVALNLPVNKVEEDIFWYGLSAKLDEHCKTIEKSEEYKTGGYYTYKDAKSLTFIRCGSHKNRPSQADNLHLDIWVGGKNLLRDSGTFLYNGIEAETLYFNSTKAHNTVQIDNFDQMKKGPRFIWFNWTKALNSRITETKEYWEFEGSIRAFGSLIHKRKVRRNKHELVWTVEDWVDKKLENQTLNQHWHPAFSREIEMESQDINEKAILPTKSMAWFAPNYGIKEESEIITFSTHQNYLKTRIIVPD